MHWTSKSRREKIPSVGGTHQSVGMFGGRYVVDRALTRYMSMESITPLRTSSCDESRKRLTITSARSDPLCRVAPAGIWASGRRSVFRILGSQLSTQSSCAFVKKGLHGFPVSDRVSEVDRGNQIPRRNSLRDGGNPGVTQAWCVWWCVRGRPSQYHCQ